MRRWRFNLRAVAVAVAAVATLAVASAGCDDNTAPPAASSVPMHGGVAEFTIVGSSPTWIWPFMPAAQDSSDNGQEFQWLMYRPLYMFGNNGNSTTVNYPLSLAYAPVYSDGGRTAVIRLKGWKWSDGEVVDARDVVFWLNMMRAEKDQFGGYSPGLLPDNLASYSVTGPDEVTLHLKQAYSSYWFTYNQLAEITPMPMAWDVTSAAGRPGSGGCSQSVARCPAVFAFLTAQAKDTKGYATSRVWRIVDGPWRLTGFSLAGDDTFVPNPAYSGSPKPRLAEVRFVPYSDDATAYAALKAGKVDMGHIPVQDLSPPAPGSALPATDPLGSGYTPEVYYQFSIYYYVLNFNNPVMGPVFRQLYVRQALQETEDQPGIDSSVYRGYALPGSGAVPVAPSTMWEPAVQKANRGTGPYPFSIAAATSLLVSHGWRKSGGVMTCQRPGTGAGDCGAGIPVGRKLAFTLDWATAITATRQMMTMYKASAALAGIDITMVGQSFQTVFNEAIPCRPGPKCAWDSVYYGFWVFNGPGFEPSGESLFQTGAFANPGSYSSPAEDALIGKTHTSSSLAAFQQYATYTAEQLPFIWMPDQYSIWAVTSKLHGVYFSPLDTLLPEYWYYTK